MSVQSAFQQTMTFANMCLSFGVPTNQYNEYAAGQLVAAEKSSENACSKEGINDIINEIKALILAAGGTIKCNGA